MTLAMWSGTMVGEIGGKSNATVIATKYLGHTQQGVHIAVFELLPVCLSAYLSVCQIDSLSVRQTVYLSVCPFLSVLSLSPTIPPGTNR